MSLSVTFIYYTVLAVIALVLTPDAEAARAFFVFGDSLVDSGNNNYLVTSARADSPPYGIDFPTHRATGRFSNGLNIPDIISEKLGAEPTIPYLSPELNGDKLLVGANFASAGIGILNDTGVQFGGEDFYPSARADSPPYGIDFPTHRATGRFSNGLNIPDIISEKLGAEPTIPYLSPELNGDKLLVGANFASAGIGILNDTGVQFANIIRMPQQFEFFEMYKSRLAALIGSEKAGKRVNEALVLITLGGNDYVNNYFFAPVTARRLQYSLPDYSRFIIDEYRKILTRLYDLGARRVLVTGSGPLGCVPSQLATRSSNGQCAEEPQQAAALYNPLLVQMIKGLNKKIGSDVFVAANAQNMQHNFISDPQAFGFVTSKEACCGQGPYNGVGVCNPTSNLCPNRNLYAFWDPFHPTERANRIIVETLYTGSEEYMHPMNLSTIMAMDNVS